MRATRLRYASTLPSLSLRLGQTPKTILPYFRFFVKQKRVIGRIIFGASAEKKADSRSAFFRRRYHVGSLRGQRFRFLGERRPLVRQRVARGGQILEVMLYLRHLDVVAVDGGIGKAGG